MFREKAQSALAGFADGSSILVELEFEEISFCRGRKTREPAGERNPPSKARTNNKLNPDMTPGARFSKLPVITGPVKLFCFPFQMRVSTGLKIVQYNYQLKKQNGLH